MVNRDEVRDMKLVLRDPTHGRYFKSFGAWTNEKTEAFDFKELEDALEIAAGLGFKHCEVILISELFSGEIRFPVSSMVRVTT